MFVSAHLNNNIEIRGKIGLIFMLSNMDGGSEGMKMVGPAMGVALVTTFYGSMFASLIFNPFSEK